MDSKDNDSIHPSENVDEEKNDCKENTAYYETAFDKSIRKMEKREARMFKDSAFDGQALMATTQMADAVQPFQDTVRPIQDALQPIHNTLQSMQSIMQPYQNTTALTGVATALTSVASVAQSLVSDNALNSMTKTLDAVAIATKPYQDLYNQYNPLTSGILSALEAAAITPELQELKTQLEFSTQAMRSGLAESLGGISEISGINRFTDGFGLSNLNGLSGLGNSLTAISDYIGTLTAQWDNALAMTDAVERSMAAQNLAVVRMLPDYEKLVLPRGGKKVLKSLPKTTAKLLMQSDKIRFDPKERDFYHKDSPDNKLSADQITVAASSLELFEVFTFDDLISFESKLEENVTFALHHPVGGRIYEILKNWNLFVGFEDITYYHARVLNENQRPYHDSEMMKAPTNVSAHGRYNEVGRSCYYIAEDRDGALKEIYKHSGGKKPRVQVIGLKAVKPVKLLDLSGNAKKPNLFIDHMRYTVENESGRTVHEYLLPNYVAACCKEIGIDGIRYRSTGNKNTGYNCCVLWKDDYFEYVDGSRGVIEPDV